MGNPGNATPPPSRPPPPPPEKENEYESHQPRSTLNKPQSFPPPQDLYPDEDEQQPFPPPQHHPQSFPPPHDEDDSATPVNPHAFPPPHDEDDSATPVKPHAFPPPHDEDDYATPVKPHAFPPPPDSDFTSPPVKPQAFPPRHDDEPQAFPPAYTNFQQQNPVASTPVQFCAPPVHGRVQMGHPAPAVQSSPFNQGATPTPSGWKSELFDFMKDPQNALITAFFPCVTFGQIAEIVDSGHSSCGTSGMMYGVIAFFIAMPCIMSFSYRTKLRSKFGLIETPAPDWAVHCFCEWCALCQEYRELKDRGYDPSIGWLGNEAAQQQQQKFPMAAPMGQTMM
ncbi:protein PLANT CADMIUM RESISTANCE 6 [Abeliophyllum distichum]|uniref:Protein PLANT CADMIUM RESISTANCE 6 n=1 Tax=Abeliophyllum distichum TaxID=126358 RepID=A0ABD1PE14_9LAMI